MNYRHGLASHRIYGIWENMKTRCYNPNYREFYRYGGRGIKVCERWHHFPNFVEDMGLPPEGMTLERQDNDRDYEPGNCIWATVQAQARNRRTTIMVTLDGKTQCLKDWATERGLSYKLVQQRVKRDGWPIEKALAA